jgi:glyoxylase-like metal-dependent hydrolase (beta-lactamase superfamily II)
MDQKITPITLPLPYGLGRVNCYLITADQGAILIDTGASNGRRKLEAALARAGCRPADLTLIVLTHGDFDHTGNAAHLRARFGVPIAMHRDDVGMAQHGDMFWNRSSGNALLRAMAPLLFRFGKSKWFTPDIHLEEGAGLSDYGPAAEVISLPGHSKGSIGILTDQGDLFCGDLFDNTKGPALNAIMDDPAAAEAAIAKLRGLPIVTVYPGHGDPFAAEALL